MGYSIDKYQLNNAQPGWPAIVPEGSINSTSTSLKIPGRGIPNYGELIGENFVHILENFAGPNEPLNPIIGQLWYDTNSSNLTHGSLKIYNGTNFVRVSGIDVDTTPFYLNSSSGKKGDLKFYSQTGKNQLYIHDGSSWIKISGVEISNIDPNSSQGDDGNKWFNTTNNKFFIKANNTWLNIFYTDGSLNYEANVGAILVSIGSLQFVVVYSEGTIIAIFSASIVSVGSLPTIFYLPNNPTPINLQSLFPNGLRVGINFSNISGNSIYSNANTGNTFTIKANSGKLKLEGASSNTIEFQELENLIKVNSPTLFTNNDHIILPVGSTTQRPTIPIKGSFRLNNSINELEFFDGSIWRSLNSSMTSAVIPAGSRMLFYQNSAPAGWVSVTGVNDSLVRIVDSGGGSLTSGNNFSSVNSSVPFTYSGNTDDHTLTVNEIPLHGHPYVVTSKDEITARMNLKGGLMMRDVPPNFQVKSAYTGTPNGNNSNQLIGGTGGGLGHKHSLTISTTLNLNIKYVNVIICQKS